MFSLEVVISGVLGGVYSDTTELNWTELNWPSWTAYSQVSRVFVYDVTTHKLSQLLFTLSSWVQLSWVELCRYKRAFTTDHLPNIIFLASNCTITQVANRPLIRSLSPKTTSKYCKSIHNADWEAVLAHVNVDRCYEVFQSKISNCFNSNFPLVRLLPRDAYA